MTTTEVPSADLALELEEALYRRTELGIRNAVYVGTELARWLDAAWLAGQPALESVDDREALAATLHLVRRAMDTAEDVVTGLLDVAHALSTLMAEPA